MVGKTKNKRRRTYGKLRIGNDWNAITIIALSQDNPLKAVAELVENSIDARARNVVITRGKEQGAPYLRIVDDGEGIPRNEEGKPNFKYVATHICDSIKRRLKAQGAEGIQGEFGIGLLSFWTLGEELIMTSSGADGKTYQMRMTRGNPSYFVSVARRLFPVEGTELKAKPLLPGLRQLSGEKIQWYLASELRDRIRQSGVHIKVIDRTARKDFQVEPREFTGRLLQRLPTPRTRYGEIYVELYLSEPRPERSIGLYRYGTRVLKDMASLEAFQRFPWTSDHLEGIVDVPFLTLTPGTRTGIIQDEPFAALCAALEPLEEELSIHIKEQERAEQERASRQILRTIQKAFKEALLALPAEEYDWFDVHTDRGASGRGPTRHPGIAVTEADKEISREQERVGRNQREQFFEYPGPLFSVRISPASSVVPVEGKKIFRAVARDRRSRLVEDNLHFFWEIIEGEGRIENVHGEIITFHAPSEPGLIRIKVTVV